MQTITKQLPVSLPYQFLLSKSIQDTDILMFDIETTGFSPDITSIYLIGCCYYQNNSWQLIQWFADDYISEQNILQSFFDFSKNFKVLIHFNGTGFDIPYIQKKAAHYKMDFSFDSFLQIDLYKKIFPYKKVLKLPNLKQKTIESFLKLKRQDEYSGGDLIEVYVNYMKDKFCHKTEMNTELEKLLLHNEEDVTNLVLLTSILSYPDIFESKPVLSKIEFKEDVVSFTLALQNSLTQPVSYQAKGLSLSAQYLEAKLSVSTHTGELKYFYPNYKDYYYLTLEDTAIHKSVAEFVDKEYRVKAKATTCYTRKNGLFLPQFLGNISPSFRKDYKDKESYIELTEAFLNNDVTCTAYVASLMQYILHKAGKENL